MGARVAQEASASAPRATRSGVFIVMVWSKSSRSGQGFLDLGERPRELGDLQGHAQLACDLRSRKDAADAGPAARQRLGDELVMPPRLLERRHDVADLGGTHVFHA